MFATTTRGSARLRSLGDDDIAFLREVYPSEVPQRTGAIEGIVRSSSGGIVIGGIVTAFDPARNVAVSAITGLDGRFRIPSLSPGEYGLIVEPLDGPATPFQMSFSRRNANTFFQTLIPGGAPNPTLWTVAEGGVASVDLTVQSGLPTYNALGLSAAAARRDVQHPGRAPWSRAAGSMRRAWMVRGSMILQSRSIRCAFSAQASRFCKRRYHADARD
ncbi:MAG: carboxypeptidase-like regulatory domain-containing protein [Bryobacterales bacterium]